MKASAPTASSKYVSSMFPDFLAFCFSFVTSQFYPNWEYFGADLLKIDFKPFGKANVRINVTKKNKVHFHNLT